MSLFFEILLFFEISIKIGKYVSTSYNGTNCDPVHVVESTEFDTDKCFSDEKSGFSFVCSEESMTLPVPTDKEWYTLL